MWKVKPHSTGEVLENTNIKKLFRSYEFLTSVARSRNLCSSHNMGKVNCHGIGKKWIKHKHSKIMSFLNVLREAETNTIPNHGKNEIL